MTTSFSLHLMTDPFRSVSIIHDLAPIGKQPMQGCPVPRSSDTCTCLIHIQRRPVLRSTGLLDIFRSFWCTLRYRNESQCGTKLLALLCSGWATSTGDAARWRPVQNHQEGVQSAILLEYDSHPDRDR